MVVWAGVGRGSWILEILGTQGQEEKPEQTLESRGEHALGGNEARLSADLGSGRDNEQSKASEMTPPSWI